MSASVDSGVLMTIRVQLTIWNINFCSRNLSIIVADVWLKDHETMVLRLNRSLVSQSLEGRVDVIAILCCLFVGIDRG